MSKRLLTLPGLALVAALSIQVAAAQAPAAFNQCKACHTIEAGKHKMGPSLFAVLGRTAGSAEGYAYSPALKSSGLVWTEENLTAYITNPKAKVPNGKTMPGNSKPDEVKAVVGYLKTVR